jgi:hypothetical protein
MKILTSKEYKKLLSDLEYYKSKSKIESTEILKVSIDLKENTMIFNNTRKIELLKKSDDLIEFTVFTRIFESSSNTIINLMFDNDGVYQIPIKI